MQNTPTTTTQIQCTLPDANGNTVTVTIDQAQAQHLLQTFSKSFGWNIHWQVIPKQTAPLPKTPDAIAQQVLKAAATVAPAGRFGTQHVFINHAWRAWQNIGGQQSLVEFKQLLLQLQQVNLLNLGCVALVQTLNAVDVSQSEILSDKDVVYHFVILP